MQRLRHVRAFCEPHRHRRRRTRPASPAISAPRRRLAQPRVQAVEKDACAVKRVRPSAHRRTLRGADSSVVGRLGVTLLTLLAFLTFLTFLTVGTPPAQAQAQALDPALAERMRDLLGSRFGTPTAGAQAPRITVDIGQLDPRLRLAPCRRIEPQLPPATPGHAIGRLRVALRCVEGERPWQVWLPVTVHVFAPALVPARALAAGSVLAEADLVSAEVDWAAGAQPPFLNAAELIGRSLARSVQAGQALREADLRRRQWFAAGDTVQVLARGAGFAVTGEAQALGPGLEGQTVRLRTESGRVLSGRAVGVGRVEVVL